MNNKHTVKDDKPAPAAGKDQNTKKKSTGKKEADRFEEYDDPKLDTNTLPKRYLKDRKPIVINQTTGEVPRPLVRMASKSAYDFQLQRIAAGNRLCRNFAAKAGEELLGDLGSADKEESKAARKWMNRIMKDYKKVTDGVLDKLPSMKEFEPKGIITNYAEAQLICIYQQLVEQELACFKIVEGMLKDIPIWTEFLEKVPGCGVRMAACILADLDPYKAPNASSFWSYTGNDVWIDPVTGLGEGRSRKKRHCVMVEYVKGKKHQKAGETPKTDWRLSVTYNTGLKTKLNGVLSGCLLRAKGESIYKNAYYGYKNRLQHRPDCADKTAGHIDAMAKRYMVKIFLLELWKEWRTLLGLPTPDPYAVAKLGMRPHHTLAEV